MIAVNEEQKVTSVLQLGTCRILFLSVIAWNFLLLTKMADFTAQPCNASTISKVHSQDRTISRKVQIQQLDEVPLNKISVIFIFPPNLTSQSILT